jgi:hypothetical protein
MDARMAMIAMTTKSSIRVKPAWILRVGDGEAERRENCGFIISLSE